jgi:hypothetical protein
MAPRSRQPPAATVRHTGPGQARHAPALPAAPHMSATPAETLRVAAAQLAAVPRDRTANALRIRAAADAAGADLVVTPELSLTGYDLGDAVHRLAQRVEPGQR